MHERPRVYVCVQSIGIHRPKSAVRFNRMDQILDAICQGLEVPNQLGNKGVYPFFNWICQQAL